MKEYNNNYYVLRHGEALSNKKNIHSNFPETFLNSLTGKGRRQIKEAAQKLKNKKIDLIFTSDLLRARQTAEIVGREIGIKPRYDKRLREYNVGTFNGRPSREFEKFSQEKNVFKNNPPKGETFNSVKKRMYDFLKETDGKHHNKNILIISHQAPLSLLEARVKGVSNGLFFKKYPASKQIKTGELRRLVQ